MPFIIQLHIMSIRWAYYEQMKQQNIWSGQKTSIGKQNRVRENKNNFIGDHSRVSAECAILSWLKLKDRHSAEFLACIQPVVQWITRQWSFPAMLSPWNARFSLLVVLGKYSYVHGQQPSRRVPPYFRQIEYARPLRMREDLSARGQILFGAPTLETESAKSKAKFWNRTRSRVLVRNQHARKLISARNT